MPRGSKPGERRGGRQKGTPNKAPAMREAFTQAFVLIGSVPALAAWAKANPTEFYKLAARLVVQEVGGPDGGPIALKWQG